jgi:hypothetical protein
VLRHAQIPEASSPIEPLLVVPFRAGAKAGFSAQLRLQVVPRQHARQSSTMNTIKPKDIEEE